jgi:hypothetical protein
MADIPCPNCDAPLLPSGVCPFEGCGDSVPDWLLIVDEEYWDEPMTELPGP